MFRLQYLFAIINKISLSILTCSVAQWVKRSTKDNRVVQGVGSSPLEVVYWNCLSNYFDLSFTPGGL